MLRRIFEVKIRSMWRREIWVRQIYVTSFSLLSYLSGLWRASKTDWQWWKNNVQRANIIIMEIRFTASENNLIELWSNFVNSINFLCTHPASPPLSILFASVTSSDQTSNCHFRKPRTPQRTLPLCTPILMSILLPVASLTILDGIKKWRNEMKMNGRVT